MPFSLETLAAVATIVGTVISALALIQSRAWLALTSLIVVALAIAAVLYARRERVAREGASTVIEGHSIDSLNMANLKRRLDRDFVIQEAEHTAHIDGENMSVTWMYSGYCRGKSASEFYFSVDSEARTTFEELEGVAYDLGHDPQMLREIRPLLVSTEGISKKISVPFLEPVKANDSFRVLLKCTLPRCLSPGTAYYASTLSFAQAGVRRCTVRLVFAGPGPSWMRVYESMPQRQPRLLKTLTPSKEEPGVCEYTDTVENIAGQSARVYLFWRDSV
jgi:hypothetical protein